MEIKDIDIFIISYNRYESLCNIIDFLSKQIFNNFNVIINDDGSRVLINPNNYCIDKYIWTKDTGYNRVDRLNECIKLSVSPIILFLDDDCIPISNNFIESHIKMHKRSDVCMGKIRFPNGSFANWGGGSNMSIKRKTIESVSGYDCIFNGNYGHEDRDFVKKLSLKECKVIEGDDESIVDHGVELYANGDRSEKVIGRNTRLFFDKWKVPPNEVLNYNATLYKKIELSSCKMKKILIIGPSAVGKTFIINKLSKEYDVLDMDTTINTKEKHHNPELLFERITNNNSSIIAVSVIYELLKYMNRINLNNNIYFVYFKTTNKEKHKERLLKNPEIGRKRELSEIASIEESILKIDEECKNLATYTVDIDTSESVDVMNLIRKIMKNISFLTKNEFNITANEIGGKHWKSPGGRWPYHELAIEWVRGLHLTSPEKVLEMGTMGVSIVLGSNTIDYDPTKNNIDWKVSGFTPTLIHDGREMPWPIKDKEYDLFIALRVFHHLVPVQKECFLEAKRIAKNMMLVVPSKSIHARGIDIEEMIKWNDGVAPSMEYHFPREAGSCFLWEWG